MADTSSTLPSPVVRGETLCIPISDDTYEKGIEVCKRNLRGRLILNKGDKPYSSREVQTKLQQLWKNIGPWKLTPLGKGYFEFYFSSNDDMRSVWSKGTQNLKPGLLRLFEWSKDFSARTQRQTHAQVWIRLHELPQEYWMDRTLREIASAVGTPLLIDSATQNRVFGHYARVLVDMDLSKTIFNEVMVERTSYSFLIDITYERLPAFCTHCRNIGHHISACRWLHQATEAPTLDKKKKSTISQKPQDPKWKPADNPDGLGSSNAFETPLVSKVTAAPRSVVPSTPLAEPDVVVRHAQIVDTAHHEIDTEDVQLSTKVPAAIPQPQPATPQIEFTEQSAHNYVPLPVLGTKTHHTLPSSSVHVLERIDETEETQDDVNNAAERPLFSDVMELEAQSQPNSTTMNVEVQQDDNESASVPHHDIPVAKNVQDDLDLWARIKEYDQRMAEEGFTQVLSKKQQKDMKNQVAAKASYNTRTRGPPPSSSS